MMSHINFYLVWNEQGQAPTKKHETLTEACREAERLAIKQPGHKFHVLEVVASCMKTEVTWSKNPYPF